MFVFVPLSPSRPDPCLLFNSLSSSFFSLSGTFVDAVSLSLSLSLSFSLSLSLSGAGETQTFLVWVFPCVLVATLSHLRPVPRGSPPTPRSPPAPVFFFSFDAVRLSGGGWSVAGCGCFGPLSLSLSWWFWLRWLACMHARIRQREGVAYWTAPPFIIIDCCVLGM